MVVLDSNIIILASKPEGKLIEEYISNVPHAVSIITQIEVLGYNEINDTEKLFLDLFFASVPLLEISQDIVYETIGLRARKKKLKLADAIIAATAIFHNFDLITNNEKDFSWIEGLTIINPLKK